MKFLVDAQLPKSLADSLREKGLDVVHTSELPDGNDTTDSEINRISITDERIFVSKDGDFYDSFTAKKKPFKLLHIKTGNIKNSQLLNLFDKNLELIQKELNEGSIVQIDQKYIIKIQ